MIIAQKRCIKYLSSSPKQFSAVRNVQNNFMSLLNMKYVSCLPQDPKDKVVSV